MRRWLTMLVVATALIGAVAATPLRQDMTTVWTYLMNQVYAGAWDDLVTVAGAVNPLGADGQASVINDATTYIGCLEFDAAGETAVAQFQLSHGTMDGKDIRPHIHWLVSGADVTGTASFEAKFRHCPLHGTCSAWTNFAAGAVELEPADAEGGTGLTAWTLADSTYAFGISDLVLMQFKLASTTVTDAVVCSVDIHFKRNGFGSLKEGSR
jgi:hypothetical protein